MSEKVPARPAWYKNTYFWIAAALFLLSIFAFLRGPDVIRDPGQKREGGLAMWYLIASVVMYVNGWLSHQQTVRLYRETVGENTQNAASPAEGPEATALEEAPMNAGIPATGVGETHSTEDTK